jgi:hypothetical protein
LSPYDCGHPERYEWADASLARWVIPIGSDTLANFHRLLTVLGMVNSKLAEAEVHRPASGLGRSGKLRIDPL